MYFTSQWPRAIAWSALAVSVARAQYVIDNLSFGQKAHVPISPDRRTIPHFTIRGSDDFTPEILTDRIFLTPPHPGNKRGSIWAQDQLRQAGDWTAELQFRASGIERGGGNLQLWYVKESQARETPTSLYTARKFDGLVLVIDQYEGHGGSVRGFLSDGSIDIRTHPDPDTLAFGKCDYAYRNRGEITPIKIHHTARFLEVIVDGASCFKTDKIQLPEGYYFGISASSAENPDSFEIHSFVVSTTNSHKREESNKAQHQQQQNSASQQGHEQQTHSQQQPQHKSPTNNADMPKILQDVLASNIHSQTDQFADLHNRIQIINNRLTESLALLEKLHTQHDQRHRDLLARIDDRTRALDKIDQTTLHLLQELEQRDVQGMVQQLHRAIENGQEGLRKSLPLQLSDVVRSHKPNMTTFLLIAVACQIMVTGAYLVYKKRRSSAPKKYL